MQISDRIILAIMLSLLLPVAAFPQEGRNDIQYGPPDQYENWQPTGEHDDPDDDAHNPTRDQDVTPPEPGDQDDPNPLDNGRG